MEPTLSAFSKELLASKDAFFAWVGEGSFRHYSTETMNKHRPVTKKALTTVAAWFSAGPPTTDSRGVEFTNAERFDEAPSIKLEVTGDEMYQKRRRSLASLVRFVVPASWGVERSAELLDMARRVSNILPFQSGSAGYAFECSEYFIEAATEHAYKTSMRHPGFDIHQDHDMHAVRLDGVRGVNWLTMLSNARVKDLGGLPSFEHCTVHQLDRGVMIQAGEAPAIGDVNKGDRLPAYREVFKLIEPLTPPVFERSPWLEVEDDGEEKTQRWYTRFSDG